MKIKIDENKYVIGYVITGDMVGATEFTGELPTDFMSNWKFYYLSNGTLILDETKKIDSEAYQADIEELHQLHDWFEWYDNQIMQYQRTVRLGETFDQDIVQLDNQAKINQLRIRNLENNQSN